MRAGLDFRTREAELGFVEIGAGWVRLNYLGAGDTPEGNLTFIADAQGRWTCAGSKSVQPG